MNGRPVVEAFDPARAALVASRSPLAAEMERTIRRVGSGSEVVVVAVSGGPDSTALLLLAQALATRRTPPVFGKIVVGHVDHGLRPEGGQESMQVRRLAERLGMAFVMERLSWPDPARVSSEQARDARWAALQRFAREHGAGTILCGHHADDQAETVILRLARGTGLRGIAGIPQVRQLDEDVRIVRPLLRARREDLLALVEASGVPVVIDPTNRRRDLARGVVRHEVLPRLDVIHPGATTRIAATAEEAGSVSNAPSDTRNLPRPESIRWSRATFRRHDETTVAGMLRETVRGLPGVAVGMVEAVPRTVWVGVARAVLGEEVHPRDFRLNRVGRIRVEARSVELWLEAGSSGGSASLSS